MPRVQINDRTEIEYEHVKITASANVITGARYFTKLYLLSNGKRYPLGDMDGELDEAQAKIAFEELIRFNQERQYGTQRGLLRKDLPVKGRGSTYRGISRSILSR